MFRLCTSMTKPRRDTLAQVCAMGADNRDGTARVGLGPGRSRAVFTPDARRQCAGIGGLIFLRPNINHERSIGSADKTRKLGRGDRVRRWHKRPPPRIGVTDAILRPKPHGAIAVSPCGGIWRALRRVSSVASLWRQLRRPGSDDGGDFIEMTGAVVHGPELWILQ
jgi:hypothetical protein